MYQPEYGKQLYNQPPSAAVTGFPVSFNSSTSAASAPAGATTTAPPLSKPLVEWSTGLCNCCSNVVTCCLTCWCPCITFGRVAEIIDKACGYSGALYTFCCLLGCGWLYSCCYRSEMRKQYGLKGNCCTDCMKHCCCEYCALCQEYRELENRGFNMVIGWHGNVLQRTGGMAMSTTTTAPAVESGMNRLELAVVDKIYDMYGVLLFCYVRQCQ
ncbi:hypothetical protein P8452_34975 [Trifolium repens]|nr:hypothetical protein P8452_34975 [Trifolium repens]